jgi:hypothetical protein
MNSGGKIRVYSLQNLILITLALKNALALKNIYFSLGFFLILTLKGELFKLRTDMPA